MATMNRISANIEHTVPSMLLVLAGNLVLPHKVPPMLAAVSPIPSDTIPEHSSRLSVAFVADLRGKIHIVNEQPINK